MVILRTEMFRQESHNFVSLCHEGSKNPALELDLYNEVTPHLFHSNCCQQSYSMYSYLKILHYQKISLCKYFHWLWYTIKF